MFAKTADTITKKLQENNSISSEQYEICRFGFQQGLTILLNAVTVITASRCYIYSILLMIAVLLAMKYLYIPTFICIIALVISCAVILILAPVEDANKPLDNIEQVVYRKRTYVITALETTIFFIALFFGVKQILLCDMWVVVMMCGILITGKCKNELNRTSDNVCHTERK